MLFNTLDFAIFLPVVFALYWFVTHKSLRLQNLLLLFASYFFYACWDWRFLFLLAFSTFLDYYSGLKIAEASDKRTKQYWLWLSIAINVGFLGVFKYYNFFADSFAEGLALLGVEAHFSTLNIILPVGISFYTFHGLSYIIDIYKDRIPPERNFVDYAVFVSFFPLLVAGPIERATHLLPQIKQKRTFSYEQGVDGLRQILWGLFKKIVIADNCAEYANQIFGNSADMNGSTLLAGALYFTFQIYCDFSGYSDIALGTARLFGIELLRNFAYPYFSRDIAEFWRRWHISLSTWFRDYLYIPLGGSRGGKWQSVKNTFIIFVVSGFWHGANWTFIVWGLLNAVCFLPLLLMGRNRNNLDVVAQGRLLPNLRAWWDMGTTFGFTVLAWVFFRAENVGHALQYLSGIFSAGLFELPHFTGMKNGLITALLVVPLLVIEWLGREHRHPLERLAFDQPKIVRRSLYYAIILAIVLFAGEEQQFIYFQF
jgi:alginate O-acetyltransferase complex protein AlgI